MSPFSHSRILFTLGLVLAVDAFWQSLDSGEAFQGPVWMDSWSAVSLLNLCVRPSQTTPCGCLTENTLQAETYSGGYLNPNPAAFQSVRGATMPNDHLATLKFAKGALGTS